MTPDSFPVMPKEALKVDQLIPGKVYQCRLSGLKMYIKKVTKGGTQTQNGMAGGTIETYGLYFNQVTGIYTPLLVEDYQLTDL